MSISASKEIWENTTVLLIFALFLHNNVNSAKSNTNIIDITLEICSMQEILPTFYFTQALPVVLVVIMTSEKKGFIFWSFG